MSTNTAVQKGLQTKSQGSVGWWKFRKKASPAFVTAITIILLGLFLMPFLYMIFTSLKVKCPDDPVGFADLAR